MDYRLTLAFRGTAYAGWQRQKNALAVQQVVEEAVGDLVGYPLRLHGASRTDAGVHADGQTAHLSLTKPFPEKGLVHGTNHRLPSDIRVTAAHRMPIGFHARKSVLGKEYVYRLFNGRVVPPTIAPITVPAPPDLETGVMRQAICRVIGHHDFSAFALAGGSHTQPWRTLFAATVHEDGRRLCFRFIGDGFLRGMVRALVGTLIEVGRGKRDASSISTLLEGRPRSEAGPSAEARGLTLERVYYGPQWQPLAGYEA